MSTVLNPNPATIADLISNVEAADDALGAALTTHGPVAQVLPSGAIRVLMPDGTGKYKAVISAPVDTPLTAPAAPAA